MFARVVDCVFFTWVPMTMLIWSLEFMILGRFLP
jgi:hypothetical protein